MSIANEWALSSAILQTHDDELHPVKFYGRVLKDAEINYHPAEKEVLALLLVLTTYWWDIHFEPVLDSRRLDEFQSQIHSLEEQSSVRCYFLRRNSSLDA
ncbi:hypothetical protein PI126_g19771 [Phytophthora idaei]|nr:hypothetical protein PI126_g19771 [Phytophthora idaei]